MTVPEPYQYHDPDGDALHIRAKEHVENEGGHAEGRIAEVYTSDRTYVTPGKVSEVCAALYAASGQTVPIMLNHPSCQIRELGREGARHLARGDWWAAGRPWDAEDIVEYAAALALAAREMRKAPEPDQADVEALALALRRHTPGMADPREGDYGMHVTRSYARAALRWMGEREKATGP